MIVFLYFSAVSTDIKTFVVARNSCKETPLVKSRVFRSKELSNLLHLSILLEVTPREWDFKEGNISNGVWLFSLMDVDECPQQPSPYTISLPPLNTRYGQKVPGIGQVQFIKKVEQ
ncbi:hypothetical protein TNCV_1190351 [Trichonephila clavipes]|nr:hypothetical protein TNCV_1190351 [Trichonephila clavipes]